MKGIYFNGNYIVKPGAYATIDGDGMMTLTAADQKIIALIGESAGGTPNEILWFDDPNVAKRVLKGGDLLKACEKAWAPVRKDGKIGEGAHIIGVIRANKATKSYLEMGDGVSVLSLISAPVARAENAGDGIFSVVGSYSGDTDKTVEVYIDSQGTQQLQDTTFCWRYAGETAWRAKKVPAQDNGNPVALVDEIKLLFADGSYVYNDIYTFDLQAEKTQRIAAVIESKDYGFLTKHTQVKYSPGSIDATMKLTVYNSDDEKYEVFDNIGAALFITYKGIQKYAGVEVKQNKSNTGKGIAEKFTILLGETEADAVEYIAVNLADDRFKRIKALADYISSFDDFQCTLSDSVAANITTADLDDMKIDISEGAGVLLAYWADIDKRVNAQSQYINITKQDPKADAPSFFDFTALSGGDDGITPASWIKFFDMFGPHPITYLVPLTGDESIHAEAREHVTRMSNALGRERFLMVGGWTGEPYTKAIERATGHNCERVQVLTPGFYDNDKNGLTLYPAYLTAAMHAGRAAFLPDGDSATFNYYNVSALEYELQPDEINLLLKNGVACLEYVMGKGQRLVQDITTYADENNITLHTERSVRILADAFNRQLRDKLEAMFVGTRGSRTVLTSCKNAVIGFLKDKVRAEEILAYRNVTLTKESTGVYVEYEAAPTEPNNFILITGHFYSDTITI